MTHQLPEEALPVRPRVLAAVISEDIGRSRRGNLRWWLSESEYRRLTVAEKRHLKALESEGLVEFSMAGGYGYTQCGLYLLTNAGRRYVRDGGDR